MDFIYSLLAVAVVIFALAKLIKEFRETFL